jgi:hypothetical protein
MQERLTMRVLISCYIMKVGSILSGFIMFIKSRADIILHGALRINPLHLPLKLFRAKVTAMQPDYSYLYFAMS